MRLYEFRELRRDSHSTPWDVLEVSEDLPGYSVREALTDRERADFYEQFLSAGRNVYTD